MKPKAIQFYFHIFIVLLTLVAPLNTAAQNTDKYIAVSGIIKDKQTNKRLEFVSISISGTNIGTVTNADGVFTIKVKDSLKVNEIDVSHIGYTNYKMSLKPESSSDVVILLTPNSNVLKEVVINTTDALSLVKNAISKISLNYTSYPTKLSAFYRETIQKKKTYINISEALIDVYKTPYKQELVVDRDRVKIFKGRKLLSPKPNDTLIIKLQGGPNLAVYADIVKNHSLLFDAEMLPLYRFELEESIFIDERLHYVIRFVPQVTLPYALYFGKLYIDKETLAFTKAQFSLDMDNKQKATDAILKKKPAKLQFKPEEVSFLIDYKQRNGKSFLHYVRNEVRFKCDWTKKWIFSTGYTIVSEAVITDNQQNKSETLSGKLAFKQNESLSDSLGDFYDSYFWNDYNIIEPTESLKMAVDKLKKLHQ